MRTATRDARFWLLLMSAMLVLALAGVATASKLAGHSGAPAIAKKGMDDPAGDNRGGEGAGNARKGADDPAGDNRGGEGAGHA